MLTVHFDATVFSLIKIKPHSPVFEAKTMPAVMAQVAIKGQVIATVAEKLPV